MRDFSDRMRLLSSLIALALYIRGIAAEQVATSDPTSLFSVEGSASLKAGMPVPVGWQANSRVLLDHGKHVGFLRYPTGCQRWTATAGF